MNKSSGGPFGVTIGGIAAVAALIASGPMGLVVLASTAAVMNVGARLCETIVDAAIEESIGTFDINIKITH